MSLILWCPYTKSYFILSFILNALFFDVTVTLKFISQDSIDWDFSFHFPSAIIDLFKDSTTLRKFCSLTFSRTRKPQLRLKMNDQRHLEELQRIFTASRNQFGEETANGIICDDKWNDPDKFFNYSPLNECGRNQIPQVILVSFTLIHYDGGCSTAVREPACLCGGRGFRFCRSLGCFLILSFLIFFIKFLKKLYQVLQVGASLQLISSWAIQNR